MYRACVSIFMAVALLMANAVSLHCYGPDCSEDPLSAAEGGHAHTAKAPADDGAGEKLPAKADTHAAHCHNAVLAAAHASSRLTVSSPACFGWRHDTVAAKAQEPPLQPPSLA